MGFRDEFHYTNKTYAEWSLENTTRDGFQGNQERLNALQKQVKSTFEQGIDRLAQSQASSSAALQGELAYQAERIGAQIEQSSRDIVSAVEQGSADVVNSIQQMSDYLGSELCEVRWAVERQTEVSQEILRVMLNSLSNESRQYFEQGVKCYETTEYDFARERFSKALEANRTNHFTYQYLGFIAVAEDNSDEAIRNFDLARKFAETGYYKALALSHLARSNHALGDDSTAVDFAKSATAAHSDTAKFWYELAAYNIYLGRKNEAISALREAIERDWTYWAVVSSDSDFDSIRVHVNQLLDELREREKQKARKAIDNLKRAMDTAKKAGAENELSGFPKVVSDLEAQYRKNIVFIYRDIVPKAQEWHDKALVITEKAIDAKKRQKASIQNEISDLQSKVDSMYSELGFLWKMLGGGILIWVIDLIIALGIGTAENILTGLFIVLSFFIIYLGGAVLVVAAIVVIFTSISKGVTISSLKSEISSRENFIWKLDNDIKKLQ